jgi:hypothetical protein
MSCNTTSVSLVLTRGRNVQLCSSLKGREKVSDERQRIESESGCPWGKAAESGSWGRVEVREGLQS